MSEGYRVEPSARGIAVYGPCPLSHLHGLTQVGKGDGFTEVDAVIAKAVGATFVLTNRPSAEAWRLELGLPPRESST